MKFQEVWGLKVGKVEVEVEGFEVGSVVVFFFSSSSELVFSPQFIRKI